jgi:hypothetical protein
MQILHVVCQLGAHIKNVNGLSYLQNIPKMHALCLDCIFGFGYIA